MATVSGSSPERARGPGWGDQHAGPREDAAQGGCKLPAGTLGGALASLQPRAGPWWSHIPCVEQNVVGGLTVEFRVRAPGLCPRHLCGGL